MLRLVPDVTAPSPEGLAGRFNLPFESHLTEKSRSFEASFGNEAAAAE